MSTRQPQMFRELARYYDSIASFKDYRAESAALERLVRRFRRSNGRDWLDVACGTGRHLEHLRKHYRVVGIDLSREMLRIARDRLPGEELRRGDMRTFRLERQFDVVSSLFSAIGHLRSESEVRTALANFARHLKPGGVVLVEPWISPDMFQPGHVHALSGRTSDGVIARVSYARRRGSRSIIDYSYLIGTKGRGVAYVREIVPGLMVAPERLVELGNAAGLRARFLRRGLPSGRGLLVGVKPGAGISR